MRAKDNDKMVSEQPHRPEPPATRRRSRRWRSTFVIGGILLLSVAAWYFVSSRRVAQWQLMAQVVQLESAGVNEQTVQPLGWSLAILGRDDEIRSLDCYPRFQRPVPVIDTARLQLNVVPWREGLREIAHSHRLVMIMENHFVSKHREMIGATLPIFRDAGFTHYAAEGIFESSEALAKRGYPAVPTGFYTLDPKFGNVLRKARQLDFQVTGYDFGGPAHEDREEVAATQLAKLLAENPETRLVVHAGFSHVLKHETDIGQRWLAALLWDKTKIEPFTIWQWSDLNDSHEWRIVAKALEDLGDFREPVLLMPPPTLDSGLTDIPRVDAILVHPRDDSVAPARRTVLFPEETRQVTGQCLGKQWPVVVAAYHQGEPHTAVPLDQVMLRVDEQQFALCIPAGLEYDIVVFNTSGHVKTTAERDGDSVRIGIGK